MGTFNGLAIPLHGGFVCETLDSTPVNWLTVTDVGACKFLSYAASANNFGVDVRMHLDWALGGQCLKAYLYHDSETLTGQAYAAMFMFQGAASLSSGTGRIAVLDLYMNLDSTYTTSAKSCSFVNFVQGALSVQALFVITNVGNSVAADDSGGFFYTSDNTVIDHALRIYIENTAYYIGLYDALCT